MRMYGYCQILLSTRLVWIDGIFVAVKILDSRWLMTSWQPTFAKQHRFYCSGFLLSGNNHMRLMRHLEDWIQQDGVVRVSFDRPGHNQMLDNQPLQSKRSSNSNKKTQNSSLDSVLTLMRNTLGVESWNGLRILIFVPLIRIIIMKESWIMNHDYSWSLIVLALRRLWFDSSCPSTPRFASCRFPIWKFQVSTL